MAKRKSLDLIVLLIISVFVITVSAQVYYSLGMTSTIDVAGTDVWFIKGSDAVSGECTVTLNEPENTTATITGLKAYPNITQTYTDPIELHNNGSQTYQVRLNPVSLSGNDTEFVSVKFTLNASAGLRTLEYTCNGTDWTIPSATSLVTLGIGEDAPIVIETKAKAGAGAGASVEIAIAVDVQ
jgi:hypothetical protein